MITYDATSEAILRKELSSGEYLLWSGRPRQGLVLRASDAWLIPLSLLYGGFWIFWESAVVKSGAPFFFVLWGVLFGLVALNLIFGRFFVDAWRRSKTFYGVTDERAIIISGLFGKSIKSLNLRTLREISVSERSDGSGTIIFGPEPWWSSWDNASWPGGRRQKSPRFELIRDARRVYETIRNAQRQAE